MQELHLQLLRLERNRVSRGHRKNVDAGLHAEIKEYWLIMLAHVAITFPIVLMPPFAAVLSRLWNSR